MRRNVQAAFFLLLTLTAVAQAGDRVAEVEITQNYIVPPPIKVKANQIGYYKATTNRVDWHFGLEGHCTSGNNLVSSWLWLTPNPTGNRWDTAYDFKWLSEDAIFQRVSNEGTNLTNADKEKAVEACNNYLAQQMSQGKSKAWVLSREHKIPGPLLYLANHEVECSAASCGGCASLSQSKKKQIELLNPVTCLKSPVVIPGSLALPPKPPIPPGPTDLKQVFGITDAKLWVNPKQASVVTQAKLNVNGELTANGPGKVRYRVVHNGGKGPINTINFSRAKTTNLSFPLTIKCPRASDASSTKTSKKGSSGGIGGLSAAPPGVKNGTIRIEIVSPAAGKKKSNDAAYSVTCKKTGTLATPLPDLKIAKAGVVKSTGFTDPAKVNVSVRNGGAAGAAASVIEVRGTVGGVVKTWTANVPALAKGEEATVEIPLVSRSEPTPPFQLKVDATRKVKESNERNNTGNVS